MALSRVDLDGVGSPAGLVTRILKLEPTLSPPIPIEEMARQLDIEAINDLETEGFEGGLLTDENRSRGIILVNREARGGRRRFTIGHELGHFLIMAHSPVKPGQFLCSRKDMLRWSTKENDRYARMEVEANEFSALLLIPPPILRKLIGDKDPSIHEVEQIASHFDVSKDAAARSYARYHGANIAIVVVKDGAIARYYPGPRFPRLSLPLRSPVPRGTVFHRPSLRARVPSDIVQTLPDNWISVEFGQRAPTLFEQAYLQANGFAMIMLWLEDAVVDDDFDPDAERTSKQRLQDRQARWQR